MPEEDKRREREAYWRQRMKDARTVYLHAKAQDVGMMEELKGGFIAPADGSFAVAKARRAEALALYDLDRIMRLWADLVARGIMPPPDEDEKLVV